MQLSLGAGFKLHVNKISAELFYDPKYQQLILIYICRYGFFWTLNDYYFLLQKLFSGILYTRQLIWIIDISTIVVCLNKLKRNVNFS